MTQLLDTVDHRRFLQLALKRRGLAAKELAAAIGRSRPWLSLMLAGQRPLDPELVAPLADALGLDDTERTHLASLVDLEAASPRARRNAWATILATRAQRTSPQLLEETAQAFSRWWVQAIAELAECDGFRPDPRWIARTLVPPITEAQAEQALRTLLDVGVLAPDEQGHLAPSRQEPTWAPHDLPRGVLSRASREAQTAFFQIATAAFDRHRYNERHSALVTFSMSEEQLGIVRARLLELERELVMLSHERGESPNRVYALATQLIPLSEFTDCEAVDEG